MRSLRWRLLAAVSVAVLLLWLLTAWFSYTKAQHEAEELMDGSLAQTGRLLLAITQHNDDDLGKLASRLATVRGAADNVYEPPLEFQLGLGDGTILARSIGAPDLPVLGVPGYSDILRKDGSWRVLNVVSGDGRHRVQVSQSIGLRDRAALEVAGQTVLPLAIITPVLLLLIYVSVVKALDPLNRLARDVAARSADNLAALSREDVPNEVGPLVAAINRLLLRVARALDNERRFTADAAHELRTPLAAIKVQTQVARPQPRCRAGDTCTGPDRERCGPRDPPGRATPAPRAARSPERAARPAAARPAFADRRHAGQRPRRQSGADADRSARTAATGSARVWRRRPAGHRLAQPDRQCDPLHACREQHRDPRGG
ncbi:histidine kinase dimerization/phospho-acceptor domain-containing protein [Thauera humireducens]|uniref:histidine kinase dimerization/phospho-acceptor domain-containing protein n=1 Tax=Thauera humireducens TaxID=1134435 RepID=UPI00311F5445